VLQEIWHRRERNIVITRAQKAGFHYYHYFQPAIGFPVPLGADSFGTGLLVLSKYPIANAMYHSFQLSGRPYALHEADFIANKGVGLLRLQVPGDEIDLYVTHLLANYNELGEPGPGDRYLAHRVGEAYELERFIEATARNNLTLVCGDFNSPSDCMVLRIQRELRDLRDAFTDMNSHDGLTFAAEDNKFSHGDHPMRMDYVLYKVAPSSQQHDDEQSWSLVASDVFKGFFTDEQGEQFPLSDHFGVTAEFVFSKSPQPLKPCQQALGERSKEKESPVSSRSLSIPTCETTTCVHCDEIKTKNQRMVDGKAASDGLTVAARCLQDVQEALLEGRAEAAARRSQHLSRSAWSLMLSFALLAMHLFVVHLTTWAWVVALLGFVYCILQYVIAFFFVTLECSTFTELANEVRLHLHNEYARAEDDQ
jgi:sphingomyelin phosphodiesterase 2